MPSTYSPREMIDRLIAFDTTSRNSNLELIGFIADYLAEYGIGSSLSHDDDGSKANLFATIGEVKTAASCFPGIPTWCPSTARTGQAIPSRPPSATAGFMVGARAI